MKDGESLFFSAPTATVFEGEGEKSTIEARAACQL